MLSDLYKLPKIIIAFLVISVSIVFIMLFNPPHTMCDTQIEHFKEVQVEVFYKNSTESCKPENPKDLSPCSKIKKEQKLCKTQNTRGACYNYFAYLKKVLKDLRLVSNECHAQIFTNGKIKTTLEEALTLMVALAWRKDVIYGQKNKFNWLNQTDMALFCKLKKKYILEYEKQSYKQLEETILSSLPSKSKNKKLLFKSSILSEYCSQYDF